MLVGSGTAVASIVRVAVNCVTVGTPERKKGPTPLRLYTPSAVGNAPGRSRKKAPPAGGKVVTSQKGSGPNELEPPPVPNMKQPTGGELTVRSLTIVHVLVPSVTLNGVNAGVSPEPTKLGTVKEKENESRKSLVTSKL
jgi:hypothetical protein